MKGRNLFPGFGLGLLLTVLQILTFSYLSAQAPEGINYQAVARDNSGNPLIGQTITVRIGVRSGSVIGNLEYQETHAVTTNQYGLFDLQIGMGTPTGAGAVSFPNINWGTADHFLQIEVEVVAGSGFEDLVTTQLMSVPYALYAKEAGSGNPGKNSLTLITAEPAGANCTQGGTKVDVGLDDDENGTLEPAEIDFTYYVCNGEDGVDGINGQDGRSINWLGRFANDPATPDTLDAYFNTTINGSLIWTGTLWDTLSVQGAIGPQGPQGIQGAKGDSARAINWLGQFATDPLTPDTLDAYFNTAIGGALIWTGTLWDTLSQRGEEGPQGPQGIQGAKGDSARDINWLGQFATDPLTPDTLDAYFNTAIGGALIWTGTLWDTLSQKGDAGAQGLAGNTVLTGNTPPLSTDGNDGDFFLDTATYIIYGPKDLGAWPSNGTSLVGPAGVYTAGAGIDITTGTITNIGDLSDTNELVDSMRLVNGVLEIYQQGIVQATVDFDTLGNVRRAALLGQIVSNNRDIDSLQKYFTIDSLLTIQNRDSIDGVLNLLNTHVANDDDIDSLNERISTASLVGDSIVIVENDSTFYINLSQYRNAGLSTDTVSGVSLINDDELRIYSGDGDSVTVDISALATDGELFTDSLALGTAISSNAGQIQTNQLDIVAARDSIQRLTDSLVSHITLDRDTSFFNERVDSLDITANDFLRVFENGVLSDSVDLSRYTAVGADTNIVSGSINGNNIELINDVGQIINIDISSLNTAIANNTSNISLNTDSINILQDSSASYNSRILANAANIGSLDQSATNELISNVTISNDSLIIFENGVETGRVNLDTLGTAERAALTALINTNAANISLNTDSINILQDSSASYNSRILANAANIGSLDQSATNELISNVTISNDSLIIFENGVVTGRVNLDTLGTAERATLTALINTNAANISLNTDSINILQDSSASYNSRILANAANIGSLDQSTTNELISNVTISNDSLIIFENGVETGRVNLDTLGTAERAALTALINTNAANISLNTDSINILQDSSASYNSRIIANAANIGSLDQSATNELISNVTISNDSLIIFENGVVTGRVNLDTIGTAERAALTALINTNAANISLNTDSINILQDSSASYNSRILANAANIGSLDQSATNELISNVTISNDSLIIFENGVVTGRVNLDTLGTAERAALTALINTNTSNISLNTDSINILQDSSASYNSRILANAANIGSLDQSTTNELISNVTISNDSLIIFENGVETGRVNLDTLGTAERAALTALINTNAANISLNTDSINILQDSSASYNSRILANAANIGSLDQSATNELISNVTISNDSLIIFENGVVTGRVNLDTLGTAERAALTALINTNTSNISLNTDSINILQDSSASYNSRILANAANIGSLDQSTTNELISNVTISNDSLIIFENGVETGRVNLDTLGTAERAALTTLINTNAANISLNTDSINILQDSSASYNSRILANAANIGSLDQSATNELISNVTISNDSLIIFENGVETGRVNLDTLGTAERAALTALINTNAANISLNTDSINILQDSSASYNSRILANAANIGSLDQSTTNELISNVTISNDSLIIFENGVETGRVDLDTLGAAERAALTALINTNAANISLNTDSINILQDSSASYNSRILANAANIGSLDQSTTNELISNVTISNDSLIIFENGVETGRVDLDTLGAAERTALAALITANTTDILLNRDSINILQDSSASYNSRILANAANIGSLDQSATNELISNVTISNDSLIIFENGVVTGRVNLDTLGTAERAALTALINTNAANISLNTDSINILQDSSASYNSRILANAANIGILDQSTTNELISNVTISNDSLIIFENGVETGRVNLDTLGTAERAALTALINTNAANISLNTDSINILQDSSASYNSRILANAANIGSLDQSATNELISNVTISNDSLIIFENGVETGRVNLDTLGTAERAALTALINTNAANISLNTDSINILQDSSASYNSRILANAANIGSLDQSATNELISNVTISNDSLIIFENGVETGRVDLDTLGTAERAVLTALINANAANISLNTDSINILQDSSASYNSRILANAANIGSLDQSATNELISNVTISNDSLIIFENGVETGRVDLDTLGAAERTALAALITANTTDILLNRDSINILQDSSASYNSRILANAANIGSLDQSATNELISNVTISNDSLIIFENGVETGRVNLDTLGTAERAALTALINTNAANISLNTDSINILQDSSASYNSRILANAANIGSLDQSATNELISNVTISNDSLIIFENGVETGRVNLDTLGTAERAALTALINTNAANISLNTDSINILQDSSASYNSRILANAANIGSLDQSATNELISNVTISNDSLIIFENGVETGRVNLDTLGTAERAALTALINTNAANISLNTDSINILQDSSASYNSRILANAANIGSLDQSATNELISNVTISNDSLIIFENGVETGRVNLDTLGTAERAALTTLINTNAANISLNTDSINILQDSVANYNSRILANAANIGSLDQSATNELISNVTISNDSLIIFENGVETGRVNLDTLGTAERAALTALINTNAANISLNTDSINILQDSSASYNSRILANAANIGSLDQSATNELISNVTISNDSLIIFENGVETGRVDLDTLGTAERATLTALINTNAANISLNTDSINILQDSSASYNSRILANAANIGSLDQSATNELISNVTISNDSLIIFENGVETGRVDLDTLGAAERTALAALITANTTDILLNRDSINILQDSSASYNSRILANAANIGSLDQSTTNELISNVTISNDSLIIFENGVETGRVNLDTLGTAERAMLSTLINVNADSVTSYAGRISTNETNISNNTGDIGTNASAIGLNSSDISTNAMNISSNSSSISSHLSSDSDLDDTNELISSAVLNGNDLEITDAGGTKTVDLGGLNNSGTDDQQLTISGGKGTISIEDGNKVILADSSATNETNTTFQVNGANLEIIDAAGTLTVPLSSLNTSTDDQLLSISSDGDTLYLENGGQVYLPDSSATNELITKAELSGNELHIIEAGDTTVVDLSSFNSTSPFSTTSNVTSNSPGTIATDDFVFGSTTLDDAGVTNEQSRFFFDKSLAAFRAGVTDGFDWNSSNIGQNSAAFGSDNRASGIGSFAAGDENEATGSYATAFGDFNTVSGEHSFAAGANNTSAGKYVAAFGQGNDINSSSTHSFSAGLNNSIGSSAIANVAMGSGDSTNNIYSIAMGHLNSAMGTRSLALGSWTRSTGNGSFAIGVGIDNNNRIVNATDNSLMVGFNSTLATFYVSGGSGAGTYGTVGIGTTSTDSLLTVAGGINAEAIRLSRGASNGAFLTSDANGNASWYTGTVNTDTTSIRFGNSEAYISNLDSSFRIQTGGSEYFNLSNTGVLTLGGLSSLQSVSLRASDSVLFSIDNQYFGSGEAVSFRSTDYNSGANNRKYAGQFIVDNYNGTQNVGVAAFAGSADTNVAVDAIASGIGGSISAGIVSSASGSVKNYGLISEVISSSSTDSAIAVLGRAAGGGHNFAGYFQGNVIMTDSLHVGSNASPTQVLSVSGGISADSLFVTNGSTSGYILSDNGSGRAVWTNPSSILSSGLKGNGVTNKLAFFAASDSLGYDNDLHWDATNKRLGIGMATPTSALCLWDTLVSADGVGFNSNIYYATGSSGNAIAGNFYIDGDNLIDTAFAIKANVRGSAINKIGVYSYATGAVGDYYGLYGAASGGDRVFGLYTKAINGSTETWSAYLDSGNVFVRDLLVLDSTFQIIKDAGAGKVLTSDASGIASWSDLITDTVSIIRSSDKSNYVETANSGEVLIGISGADRYKFLSGRIEPATKTVFIGESAGLNDPMTGFDSLANVGIGYEASRVNSGAEGGVAIGAQAMLNNTSGGNYNTAIGAQAMRSNSNGQNATAVGSFALQSVSSGSGNSAFGSNALKSLSSGANNLGIGNAAGSALTSGSENIFIGSNSGSGFTSGSNQLFISDLIYGNMDEDSVVINGVLMVDSLKNGSGYTFPGSDGTANQIMKTDGSGKLTFVDASSLISGDNLGNHQLDSNLKTNGFYLSNDGDDEGIHIATSGNVTVGSDKGFNQFGVWQESAATELSIFSEVSSSTLEMGASGSSGEANIISAFRFRGDWPSFSSVAAGDDIFKIEVAPHNGSSSLLTDAMNITVDEVNGSDIATRIDFSTVDASGSNATRLSIDGSSGNVGIGNTNPDSTFTVNGGIKTTYFTMTNGATNNYVLASDNNGVATWTDPSTLISNDGNGIYSGSSSLSGNTTVAQGANTLAFTTTATNGFSIDGTTFSVDGSNDAVGFGTASPSYPVHISSTGNTTVRIDAGSSNRAALQFAESAGTFGSAAVGFETSYNGSDDKFMFRSASGGTIDTLMTLDRTTGNVGIQNHNPVATLDIGGALKLDSVIAATPASGMIQWTGTDFEGYTGSSWVSLTATSSATCPSGFSAVGSAGYCMQDKEQANAADWFTAAQGCATAGYKLPTWAEWYAAANTLGLTDETDDWEWVDGGTSNTARKVGNGGITNTANDDPSTGSAAYRCIIYQQ